MTFVFGYGLIVVDSEGKATTTKGNAMLNPIPKQSWYATLNANDVARLINELPEKHRATATLIYMGTINMCHDTVAATIEASEHRDAKEYPVVTD